MSLFEDLSGGLKLPKKVEDGTAKYSIMVQFDNEEPILFVGNIPIKDKFTFALSPPKDNEDNNYFTFKSKSGKTLRMYGSIEK